MIKTSVYEKRKFCSKLSREKNKFLDHVKFIKHRKSDKLIKTRLRMFLDYQRTFVRIKKTV